jgi:hypothetical protein
MTRYPLGRPRSNLGTAAAGMRLWSSAHNSFGWVVMMVKVRILSPAGERQVPL